MKLNKLYFIPFIALFFSACLSNTNEFYDPSKAHHTKTGFKNLYINDNQKGGFFKFLKMRYFGDEKWADHESLKDQVKVVDVDLDLINSSSNKPIITWLGHSTFLLQYKNINILTDPIFSDRASPLCFAGPKRYVKHPMDYKDLPKIDYVVISHNHYDHLDEDSLKSLFDKNKKIKFFVPLGIKELLDSYEIDGNNIIEMDWHDVNSDKINNIDIKIKAHPSQHWSARSLTDRFSTLWASWSINIDDFNLWFAGDTGYNDIQFKEIGDNLKEIDLSLIPIGAYAPRWFMKYYHANPKEAVYIHKDIKSKKSIGMHWGTFPLTAEEPNDPVIKLKEAKKQENIKENEFITLDIGESLEL